MTNEREFLRQQVEDVVYFQIANDIPTEGERLGKIGKVLDQLPQALEEQRLLFESLKNAGIFQVLQEITGVEVKELPECGQLTVLSCQENTDLDKRWVVHIQRPVLSFNKEKTSCWWNRELRVHVLRAIVKDEKPVVGELKITLELARGSTPSEGFILIFTNGSNLRESSGRLSEGREVLTRKIISGLAGAEKSIGQKTVIFTDSGELLLPDPVRVVNL